MKKDDILRRLLPVVNAESWDRMEDYLNYQRATLVENLIKSSDIKQINKLQGQIDFLDQLMRLPADTRNYS